MVDESKVRFHIKCIVSPLLIISTKRVVPVGSPVGILKILHLMFS